MDNAVLIPHLFRTEYRKIISVLCRHFGFDQIEMAEDITSDTFLAAAQVWGLNGVPQNPVAWLYHVAKNKAINQVKRARHFETHISPGLANDPSAAKTTDPQEQDIDLSPENIKDSQLRMMFAVCHPSIAAEAQIGLSLRILCGFGIEEIADAFLTNKETISKRLYRAKEKLREERICLDFPGPGEIADRLTTVLATIYLLFNEGYYSLSGNSILRKDLCLEAMRLCIMLTENKSTDLPAVNALLALMCFHASRFDARLDSEGAPVLYQDQDTALWDQDLIAKGGYYLQAAGKGNTLSKYHLEAGIAYWNTRKEDSPEKWENILQFYNLLLQMEYSPIAALNRTYALSRAKGREIALIEAEKLRLTGHQFYFALLGELYTGLDNKKALHHFQTALSLARTSGDRKAFQRKIEIVSEMLQ